MTRPTLQPPLRIAQVASLVMALLLAACRTLPPPGVGPAASVTAEPAATGALPLVTPRPTLAAEQTRLAALFRGTPVTFALQPDGSLRIDVPLRYCFDAGRFTVKPALAAVLVQVALSQEDGGSRIAVGAPGDALPRGKTDKAATARRERLVSQRAASVREHLTAQGIADSRVTTSTAVTSSAPRVFVTLVVSENAEP